MHTCGRSYFALLGGFGGAPFSFGVGGVNRTSIVIRLLLSFGKESFHSERDEINQVAQYLNLHCNQLYPRCCLSLLMGSRW